MRGLFSDSSNAFRKLVQDCASSMCRPQLELATT